MDAIYVLCAVYGTAALVMLIALYKVAEGYRNTKFWKANGGTNFPVKYKGKTFWHSRSVAVAGFVFARNTEGKWCVLANKRGKGTPDFQGYWCCPCGYLDYNETAQEAIARECNEECGIIIEPNQFEMVGVDTSPQANRQNVTIKHRVICHDKVADDFVFSTANMEKDEVDEIKFIPLEEAKKYQWAFGHFKLIKELSEGLE